MAQRESQFDPNAKTSTSSAAGLYQFTNATWKDVLTRYGPKYDLGPYTSKTDPRASALMAAELSKENERALVRAGLEPSDASLYVLHFAGTRGGIDLLEADPNTAAASILPQAAKANRSIFYDQGGNARTVSAVIGRLTSGFDGSPGAETSGLPSNGEVAMAARQLFVKQAREAWPSFQASIDRGRMPLPDDLLAVQYAASLSGDKDWITQVDAAVKSVGIVPALAATPAAQTKADLDRLSAQFAQGGWTIDESATSKASEDQFNLQQKQLAEDPVGFAVRFRGAAVDPLDLNTGRGLGDGLRQRVILARGIADGQGIAPVSVLSAADKAALASAITSPFSVKADLAQGAAAAAGRELPRGSRPDENAFAFLSAIPDDNLVPSLAQPEIKTAINGALRSTDPTKFNAAMGFVDQLWSRAPEEVKNLLGADAVDMLHEWQAPLRYYSPEEMLQELKSRDDPEVQQPA
jgi:hypothetical protein